MRIINLHDHLKRIAKSSADKMRFYFFFQMKSFFTLTIMAGFLKFRVKFALDDFNSFNKLYFLRSSHFNYILQTFMCLFYAGKITISQNSWTKLSWSVFRMIRRFTLFIRSISNIKEQWRSIQVFRKISDQSKII